MGSAVTGLIGQLFRRPRLNNTPVLNYRFTSPGGIREKLDYAFAAQIYERVVLPMGAEDDVAVAITAIRDGATSVAPHTTGAMLASGPDFATDLAEVEAPAAAIAAGATFAAAQTAEVIFAHNLQVVADASQSGHWRQYQYVRCPELLWGIHRDHGERAALAPAGRAPRGGECVGPSCGQSRRRDSRPS